MATSSREARRRRILERGSDRLAFITGQIHNIPDPPPSDSSSPSESLLRSDESLSNPILSDEISASTSQQENISDAMLIDDDTDHAVRSLSRRKAEAFQPQMSAGTSANAPASEPVDASRQSPTISATRDTPVTDLGAHEAVAPIPLRHLIDAITPNHVGAAIDASEYARMFCSSVIGLAVVLSRFGFSFLGSIVGFRPVFLLLLTDATIVLGRVLLNRREDSSTGSGRENRERGIVDPVSNALEMALMVKKIMNAVLMDFSVYAVILICGLLFSQNNFA